MRDDMSEANARIDRAIQQLRQGTGDFIGDLEEFIANLDAAADAALLPPDPPLPPPPPIPVQRPAPIMGRTGYDGCE
jgi:hypothetical protein